MFKRKSTTDEFIIVHGDKLSPLVTLEDDDKNKIQICSFSGNYCAYLLIHGTDTYSALYKFSKEIIIEMNKIIENA